MQGISFVTELKFKGGAIYSLILIRNAIITTLTFATMTVCLASCALSPSTAERFNESAPRQIGIILGAHVFGTTGTYLPGLWGLLTQIHADLPAQLENQINQMMLDQVRNTLEMKGYRTLHLGTVHQEWSLFSNISDSPKVYADLISKYHIVQKLDKLDAILILEYMLEPRLRGVFSGERKIEDLTIGDFQTKFAKSKIWIYDTRRGLRLFHMIIQKGYSEFDGVTIEKAINSIIDLSEVPKASIGIKENVQ